MVAHDPHHNHRHRSSSPHPRPRAAQRSGAVSGKAHQVSHKGSAKKYDPKSSEELYRRTNHTQAHSAYDNQHPSADERSGEGISIRPAQTGRTLRTTAQLERIRAEAARKQAEQESDASSVSSVSSGTEGSSRGAGEKRRLREGDRVPLAATTSIHRAQKPRSLVSNNPAQTHSETPHKRRQASSTRHARETSPRPSVRADQPSSHHTPHRFPHCFKRDEPSAATVGQANFKNQIWSQSDHERHGEPSSVPFSELSASRNPNKTTRPLGTRRRDTRRRAGNAFLKSKGAQRLIAVIMVCVLAGGILGFVDNILNSDRIFAGVWIGDVEVGGSTIDEATQLVTDKYVQRVANNTVVFYANEEARDKASEAKNYENIQEQISYEESLSHRNQWTVPASSVEATLDVDALVQEAYEVGRNQGGLIARLQAQFQGWHIDVLCSFNSTLFEELRTSLTDAVGTMRVNYNVKLKDGIASVTDGHDGEEVTAEWLAERLNATYLGDKERETYILKTEPAPLQVSEEQAQRVADSINASIAQGAEFTYEDQSWVASREDIAQWVTTSLEQTGDSWVLKPCFDTQKAKSTLFNRLHSSINENDLRVVFEKNADNSLMVTTNATGTIPLVTNLIDTLNQMFFVAQARTESPTYHVESTDIPSSLTFEDARDLGIITKISTYTTHYSSEARARRNNIHTAADYLNYSIVKAGGGTWSFNDRAGEATKERGYQDAGAIVGGEYSDAIGGGICQVATTVFNAVYDSGFPILERHNHSLHIASYPKGRDAAIAYPTYDLVWENDSDSDVLLVMSYTNSSLTATLWGVDPEYQVSTKYGDWEEGKAYSTKYRVDDSLAPGTHYVETTGVNGVSITIVRTVKDKEGAPLHEDTFSSSYAPKNEVIVKSAQ